MRAAEEDEHPLPVPLDCLDAALVALDRRWAEAGKVGRVQLGCGLADRPGGLPPARAEDERDVERLVARAAVELGCGLQRGGQRVVGHAASLLLRHAGGGCSRS